MIMRALQHELLPEANKTAVKSMPRRNCLLNALVAGSKADTATARICFYRQETPSSVQGPQLVPTDLGLRLCDTEPSASTCASQQAPKALQEVHS